MVVVVAQVVRGHHAQVPDEAGGQSGVRRDLVRVGGEQAGQHVLVVHQHRALPGQVVQANVAELHPVRGHLQQGSEVTLEPDRHVAQADGAVARGQQRPGDDSHGVGEVDDEC